jgi:glucose/arabinose dehydrogenase
MKRMLGPALALVSLIACGDDASGPGHSGEYTVTPAFAQLDFSTPTDIQNARDGSDRVFVSEQPGRIWVFENRPDVDTMTVFLDIRSRVLYQQSTEMGFLGFAFHPDYESNGYFFVHYTTTGDDGRAGRVSRFHVSSNPDRADEASEKILLEFDDDYPNHNGGALCFGNDGYLYIAIGDEGGAGDPDNNAQNRARIFGKILRIDVDQNVDTEPYHGIPPDNPYAGNDLGYRDDVWAYGLRNPWRISFDSVSGTLMAGDVGQGSFEEVDIIEKGGNYGWDCREGLTDYDEQQNSSSPLCATTTGLRNPVLVYGRSEGNSITGGYVYRGPSLPGLSGKYVYGDFGSGRIWALSFSIGRGTLLIDTGMFISTFGVTQNRELLIGSYFADGSPSKIYKLVETVNP